MQSTLFLFDTCVSYSFSIATNSTKFDSFFYLTLELDSLLIHVNVSLVAKEIEQRKQRNANARVRRVADKTGRPLKR